MPAEFTRMPGSTESRLEALEAKADALEAHLRLGAHQVIQLIEHRKDALLETVDQLVATIRANGDLPAATKQEIDVARDELKEQIRRGRVDTPSALAAQGDRLAVAVAEFDGELVTALARAHRQLDVTGLRALRRCQRAREALAVEIGLAEFRSRLDSHLQGAPLQQRKDQVLAGIEALKARIGERREHLARERERSAKEWRMVDVELAASVDQVAESLERLLS